MLKRKHRVIVFKTREERKEAKLLGACTSVIEISFMYPQLYWVDDLSNKNCVEKQQSNIDNAWSYPEYIKLLQESVSWSDIRKEYLQKHWYEIPENIGKVVMVRDGEHEIWRSDIFNEYNTECDYYPFQCTWSNWEQARLCEPSDLACGPTINN